MLPLALLLALFVPAGHARADEKLTGVSRDGLYYRLGEDVVCKALAVAADGSATGYPECRRLGPRERKGLALEAPKRRGGPRLVARLVDARPADRSPEDKSASVDPLFGKPLKRRDQRWAVVSVGKDGAETIVAYWAGHPEVVAVEELVLSKDGRTAVVVYDPASLAQAKVVLSAIGFRLR